MANELTHKSVGAELTQAEFEATDGHVFDSQATGDILYASSAAQLRRLAVGAAGSNLTVVSGVPAWAAPSFSQPAYAIDTVYQNTSGRTLTVIIIAAILASGVVNFTIGATSSPATQIGRQTNNGSSTGVFTLTFKIPVGYYYKLNDESSVNSVVTWSEFVE